METKCLRCGKTFITLYSRKKYCGIVKDKTSCNFLHNRREYNAERYKIPEIKERLNLTSKEYQQRTKAVNIKNVSLSINSWKF